MTASADIATASVKNTLLVPNGALRFTPATTAAASRGIVSSLTSGRPRSGTSAQAEAVAADGSREIWVLRNGAATAVTVKVGLSDGRHTAIAAGDLAEGDAVITESTRSAS